VNTRDIQRVVAALEKAGFSTMASKQKSAVIEPRKVLCRDIDQETLEAITEKFEKSECLNCGCSKKSAKGKQGPWRRGDCNECSRDFYVGKQLENRVSETAAFDFDLRACKAGKVAPSDFIYRNRNPFSQFRQPPREAAK
jgi:hypothetical protein